MSHLSRRFIVSLVMKLKHGIKIHDLMLIAIYYLFQNKCTTYNNIKDETTL